MDTCQTNENTRPKKKPGHAWVLIDVSKLLFFFLTGSDRCRVSLH